MFRSKEHKKRVNRGFIERTSKVVIKRSSRSIIGGDRGGSEVDRRGRRSSMMTRNRRNKRRVVRQRRGERKRGGERTKFVRARSRENRIMQRNVDAMSITRGVDVSVVAIMRDELVKVSKRNTNEKVEGGVHDKEIK